MASIWCVTPDTQRIDLVWDRSGDHVPFWIKLKKRVNVGEQRRIETGGFRGVRRPGGDAEIDIDWQAQSFARAEVYITDWSLEDDAGLKLKPCRETYEALDPEVFKLIEEAITTHLATMEAAKNAQAGGSRPSAISA